MVFMDELAKKNLDLEYILKKIEVFTPYGKTYKEQIRPFLPGEEEKLKIELDKVENIQNYIEQDIHFYNKVKNIFLHIKDLRNSVRRAMEGYVLTEVELFEIKNFLFLIRDLAVIMESSKVHLTSDMKVERIENLENLLDPEETGLSTFYIYDCYSHELRRIRGEKKEIERELKFERKKARERVKEDLNLDLRPDGSIVVPKEERELLKRIEFYPFLTYSSESYMNIKFSIKPSPSMTHLRKRFESLKEREEREEYNIRKKLSNEIGNNRKKLFRNMASIGKLDLIMAKAVLSANIDGVKPEILDEHYIYIEEGRHPKVERFLNDNDMDFTPISVELGEGITCITGANMGGKTVSLRLIGLLTAMAQHGLLVPAKSMKLGLNSFISTSIGDMQSTDKGLSTFGAEIKLIQEAIEKSHERGLILIDELARGTNPEEGYAISKSIVNFLKDKSSITVITTHYDNIANIEGVVHLQVVGLSNIDFEQLEEELKNSHIDKIDMINRYMDYRLIKVEDDKEVPRDAINIARLMGLCEKILLDAEKTLKNV
jgi:DNA mismatch repair protein MutS2